MAPALVLQGMNPMAVHLFILYWASLSNVTPPVGLAVIAASGIAGSRLMPAMVESVRFATVKYALPFFFVYAPVLVLQNFEWGLFIKHVTIAAFGAAVLAYSLQGYLPWVGALRDSALGALVRTLMAIGALLLMFPETLTDLTGLAIVLVLYAMAALIGHKPWFPLVRPASATPPGSRAVPERA
jgi:TRAP-type uncharacterized transport system fused permease subunit